MMWIRCLRELTRRYPFNTPRASLLRALPEVPEAFGAISAKAGLRYVDYPAGNDHVSKSVFWFGDFDPWVVEILVALVRQGDVACDIGANIGDTALAMAQAVGPTGRVFCFEPVPVIADVLRRNLSANQLGWSEVVPVALSDASGVVTMCVPTTQPGMSRVSTASDAMDGSERVSVEVRTFDEWAATVGVTFVMTCKVDVEGHEERVFAGMSASLGSGAIGSIVFERHGSVGRDDVVVGLFQRLGYVVYRIHKGMMTTRLVPLGQPSRLAPTSDYVAVSKGGPCPDRIAKFVTQPM